MAGAGLLKKLLNSPEMMMALLGGGGGALMDGEDRGTGAAIGASLGAGGAGLGRMVRKGLLSRVATDPAAMNKTAYAIKQSAGVPKSEIGRMPTKAFHDNLRTYAEQAAGQKKQQSIENFARGAGMGALGLGAAGGIGAALYQSNKGMTEQDDFKNFAQEALSRLGYDADKYGVRAFQMEHDLTPSGAVDEDTLDTIISVYRERQKNREVEGVLDEGPPAPSLAPHRRR